MTRSLLRVYLFGTVLSAIIGLITRESTGKCISRIEVFWRSTSHHTPSCFKRNLKFFLERFHGVLCNSL